nr:MAG TPA: PBP-dependent ABC transporter [Caudoviricetes sp.]
MIIPNIFNICLAITNYSLIVTNAWRWVIDETAVLKFIAYVWVATK